MLLRRVMDRCVRWLLTYRPSMEMGQTIAEFGPALSDLRARLPQLLVGAELAQFEHTRQEYIDAGVPQELATWAAGYLPLVRMLDVIDIAGDTEPAAVAHLYFRAADKVGFTALMNKVRHLPQTDRWNSL